jgi:hypothetical protein
VPDLGNLFLLNKVLNTVTTSQPKWVAIIVQSGKIPHNLLRSRSKDLSFNTPQNELCSSPNYHLTIFIIFKLIQFPKQGRIFGSAIGQLHGTSGTTITMFSTTNIISRPNWKQSLRTLGSMGKLGLEVGWHYRVINTYSGIYWWMVLSYELSQKRSNLYSLRGTPL